MCALKVKSTPSLYKFRTDSRCLWCFTSMTQCWIIAALFCSGASFATDEWPTEKNGLWERQLSNFPQWKWQEPGKACSSKNRRSQQRHPTTVFWKFSVRRSKNCLEFSIPWGRLKISRWLSSKFPTIFGSFIFRISLPRLSYFLQKKET